MNAVDALPPYSLRFPERINALGTYSWARHSTATSASALWNEDSRATGSATGSPNSASACGRTGHSETCKPAALVTLSDRSTLRSVILARAVKCHQAKIWYSPTGHGARH